MKVFECLSNIPEKPLGYIRMIDIIQGGEANERTLDTYNNKELLDAQQKDAHCYYSIGEYWHIIFSK